VREWTECRQDRWHCRWSYNLAALYYSNVLHLSIT